MTDHDRTVPLGPSDGAALAPETGAVRFPDITPVDANQDQTTVDPTAIDQTIVSPTAGTVLPARVLTDFEHPPLEPAPIVRPSANAEPKTEWMSGPPKKSVAFAAESPSPVDLATEDMPAPTISSEETGPLPELRTGDMQAVVGEPARSSADLPRQQSGWGPSADWTELEPKKNIPPVNVEPEPILQRAPILKAAEVPSARRVGGPGARLVEIVRPAPVEPEPSIPPPVTLAPVDPAPQPSSVLEKIRSLEPATAHKVIKVMQVIAMILTAILVLLILGLVFGTDSTPSTPLLTPKVAAPARSP